MGRGMQPWAEPSLRTAVLQDVTARIEGDRKCVQEVWQARPSTNPGCQALPSILLSKVNYLDNKIDLDLFRLVQLTTQSEHRDCCVYSHGNMAQGKYFAAIQLACLIAYCADRIALLCAKTVVVSVFTYKEWYRNVAVSIKKIVHPYGQCRIF